MFKSLKEKLGNLFKKKDKEEVEEVKEEKQKAVEEKPEKTKEKKVEEPSAKEIEKQVEEKLEKEEQEEKAEEAKEEEKEKKHEEALEKKKEEVKEENKEELDYITEELKEDLTEEKPVEEKPSEKEVEEKTIEKPIKEEVKEEPKKEEIKEPEPEVKESQGFFSKLKGKFSTVTLDQQTFDEFFEKLEMLLIENNVALAVVDKIREDMEKSLIGIEIKKEDIEDEVKNSLRDSIKSVLLEPFDITDKIKEKEDPFIILFFGINGSGKTTSISKLAHLLKENKIPSVLAAGDTFRAASIEQLEKHGEKLGIKVISQSYGADPAAVAFDAIKYAKSHGIKAVLIDTAGRMHTRDNLLKEMEKIIRVTKPDLKIFVAESITGNDATEQARTFNESFGIDGSILSKADVDEKGGTAISIGHITGKPILFLGTGQEYQDLEKFSSEEILAGLGLD